MNPDLTDRTNGRWIKAGSLLIDLVSMQKGFFEAKRYRQEIWDYIRYRESLVKWPLLNEQIRGGAL
jgi:hypothetical protein